MAREVITDAIWAELAATLRKYGCHRWKNDRAIMEAIFSYPLNFFLNEKYTYLPRTSTH